MANPLQAVTVGRRRLPGELYRAPQPKGLVVFAHGSGSSRLSARNQRVARSLQMRGLSTLLFDLLTQDEGQNRDCVFDIGLLADRVTEAIDGLGERMDGPARLPLGLFGASTGAAAALVAAARRPGDVQAVVSRGGRPDLAADHLPQVRAPTLLIVGAADTDVVALNRQAMRRLTCEKELVLVPRATHLFEEAGTLDEVARLAGDWFESILGRPPAA